MSLKDKVKKTALAWGVWYLACAGCYEQPRFRVTEEAGKDLASLFQRSEAAKAERLVCLEGRKEGKEYLVTGAKDYPWQVASPLAVQAHPLSCLEPKYVGMAHTHILKHPSGELADRLSGPDSLTASLYNLNKEWGVHCVVYSTKGAVCTTPLGQKRISF